MDDKSEDQRNDEDLLRELFRLPPESAETLERGSMPIKSDTAFLWEVMAGVESRKNRRRLLPYISFIALVSILVPSLLAELPAAASVLLSLPPFDMAEPLSRAADSSLLKLSVTILLVLGLSVVTERLNTR